VNASFIIIQASGEILNFLPQVIKMKLAKTFASQ